MFAIKQEEEEAKECLRLPPPREEEDAGWDWSQWSVLQMRELLRTHLHELSPQMIHDLDIHHNIFYCEECTKFLGPHKTSRSVHNKTADHKKNKKKQMTPIATPTDALDTLIETATATEDVELFHHDFHTPDYFFLHFYVIEVNPFSSSSPPSPPHHAIRQGPFTANIHETVLSVYERVRNRKKKKKNLPVLLYSKGEGGGGEESSSSRLLYINQSLLENNIETGGTLIIIEPSS